MCPLWLAVKTQVISPNCFNVLFIAEMDCVLCEVGTEYCSLLTCKAQQMHLHSCGKMYGFKVEFQECDCNVKQGAILV